MKGVDNSREQYRIEAGNRLGSTGESKSNPQTVESALDRDRRKLTVLKTSRL